MRVFSRFETLEAYLALAKYRPHTGQTKTNAFTPLGIIATFVALAEVIAGLAAVKTEGIVQMIFAVFSAFFPIFIAGIFFIILWKRSYVFYPPQEFGTEVDVRHYVEAMRHQAIGNQELTALVKKAIGETLSSPDAIATLAHVPASQDSAEEALKQASASLVEQAVDRLQSAVITIDITEFSAPGLAPNLVFPFDGTQQAFSLLSAVYFQIDDQVPPFTYGKLWALQDMTSGELLLPSGVDWTNEEALANSRATVGELGLQPGRILKAVRLTKGSKPKKQHL